MFGILKPFLWHFGQLFFPQKGVGAFIRENTLYISLLHITQELLQLLNEFSFSYSFLLFFERHPQLVCEHVKELNYMCHTQKKNMSRQAWSMFEPNSDYI